MKKYIFLFLSILLVLALVGCSSAPTSTNQVGDVIYWNGALYENTGKEVTGDLLGNKLGEIKQKIGDQEKGYQFKDGDATQTDVGAMVYWVYQEDKKVDKITVKKDGKWMEYSKVVE